MRLVILETKPTEIPRLKRYDKLFQDITWLVIITAYIFSWLPQPGEVEIERFWVNLVVLVALVSEFIAYRILPFEKRSGFFKYSYKLKALMIGILNHFLISAYVIFTGGAHSLFVYLYSLPLVAAAVYLPLWAVLVEFGTISTLYPIFALFVAPSLGLVQVEFWHFYKIPVDVAALAFIISLTYPQAKEILAESMRNLKLAEKIKEKSLEVEAERNKLKVILAGIRDGVIALDNDTRIIFANPAAEQILKLPINKILGRPVDEILKFVDNNQKISPLEFCPIEKPTQDKVVFAKEYIKLETPANKAYVSVISSTIREAAVANLGCILTFWDVTREKQLEEMKIDFVSMAVHELRTPLTIIRGYISVLEEEIANKLTVQEFSDFQKIKIAGKQLATLVENLLNVSRIERGALRLEIKATDWESLAKEILNEFTDLAKQKKLRLIFKSEKNLPKVAVDKFRISEVLSNLLSNAINFTKAGSVTIVIKKQGKEILTAVSDTGPGIPEEAVPNLFTKFFRVSGVLEHGSKGTGLGLFIAKSIVEMHHGKIWVDTKLGQGSTFYFTVPVYSKKLKIEKGYFAEPQPVIVN